MSPVQTILHATDFSESCAYAFRLAGMLAHDQGARLIVLHVSPTVRPIRASPGQFQPLRPKEPLQENLHRLQVSDPQVRLEHRLVEGDPATEIVRQAEEVSSDLIIMGLHGRTGLERVLAGSVVDLVLRKASCPVLLVKVPEPCFP